MNVKMPAQAEIIRTLTISARVIDILLFLDSKTIMYINEPDSKPVYDIQPKLHNISLFLNGIIRKKLRLNEFSYASFCLFKNNKIEFIYMFLGVRFWVTLVK